MPKRKQARKKLGRPPLGKKRMMLTLHAEVYAAIVLEANRRKLSLGDLVAEAFSARQLLVAK